MKKAERVLVVHVTSAEGDCRWIGPVDISRPEVKAAMDRWIGIRGPGSGMAGETHIIPCDKDASNELLEEMKEWAEMFGEEGDE